MLKQANITAIKIKINLTNSMDNIAIYMLYFFLICNQIFNKSFSITKEKP